MEVQFYLSFFLIGFCNIFQSVHNANILCLMDVPSISHHIWNQVLVEELTAKGHNVTVISPNIKNVESNSHYLELEEVYPTVFNGPDAVDLFEMARVNIFESIPIPYTFGLLGCSGTLKSNGLQKLLNYTSDYVFDLILYDFTCGPCLLPFLHYFNYPPMVAVTPFLNPPYTTDLVGGHKYPAYIPYFGLPYDTDMNFWQRSLNIIVQIYDTIYRQYIFLPKIDALMRQTYPFEFPYVDHLQKQTKLLLVNAHTSFDYPEPLPPNIIAVGGLHIKEPKPLPKKLREFIESGEKGAVLFSLGSNIRSDKLTTDIQMMFIQAFNEIPQYNFLWKFESNELPVQLPKNMMISSWLPQNDILAHPNMKGFITHSGGLSTQEASWYGVPMIGMPFLCDQHRNLYKSMQAGVAEKLLFQNLSVAIIRDTVLSVLENPSYLKKMKIRSHRFRDQPEKPLERAIWWIEWVLRNPDPDHIQSPVLKLGYFRANLFDIYLYVLSLFLLFLYCLKNLLCYSPKSKKRSNSKNFNRKKKKQH